MATNKEIIRSLRELPEAIARAMEQGPMGRVLASLQQDPSGTSGGGSGGGNVRGGGSRSGVQGPPWFQKAFAGMSKAKEFLYEQSAAGKMEKSMLSAAALPAMKLAGPKEGWEQARSAWESKVGFDSRWGRDAPKRFVGPPAPPDLADRQKRMPPPVVPGRLPKEMHLAPGPEMEASPIDTSRLPPGFRPDVPLKRRSRISPKALSAMMGGVDPEEVVAAKEARKLAQRIPPAERPRGRLTESRDTAGQEMATKEIVEKLNKLIDVQEATKQAIEDAAATNDPDKPGKDSGGGQSAAAHPVVKAVKQQEKTQQESARKGVDAAQAVKMISTLAKLA